MRIKAVALVTLTCAVCVAVSLPAGALTRGQLQTKLLSVSNLPTGWSVDNSSSSKSSITSGCLAGIKQAPKSEVKVSASFANGQLPVLEEELVTGRSASAAAYNRLTHILAVCKHFSESSGGQTVNYTVGAMSFPPVANTSSAYSVTFSVQGVNAGFDVVVFRAGTIAGLVALADIGQVDTGQLQSFVTEAGNKVEGKPVQATL